jgi:hypothetical protein
MPACTVYWCYDRMFRKVFRLFFLTEVYILVSWVFFSMCTIMGVVTVIEAHKMYDEHWTCTFNEGNSVTLTVKQWQNEVTFRKCNFSVLKRTAHSINFLCGVILSDELCSLYEITEESEAQFKLIRHTINESVLRTLACIVANNKNCHCENNCYLQKLK